MTDKEKLIDAMRFSKDNLEDILFSYFQNYGKDFSASRLDEMIKMLNDEFLHPMICKLERVKGVAWERALYLKTYLEGNLYTTKEAAIAHVPIQIKNAKAIMDVCEDVNMEFTEEDWM